MNTGDWDEVVKVVKGNAVVVLAVVVPAALFLRFPFMMRIVMGQYYIIRHYTIL